MLYKLSKKVTVLGQNIKKPNIQISFLSYLIRGEKNVLVDTVPEKNGEFFLEQLEKCITLDKLDGVIINHSEADHTGALQFILREIPSVPIYCTQACKENLEKDHLKAQFTVVQSNDTWRIGEHIFKFIHTPGLHWQDNMVTFYEREKILFSNDLFGQYLCNEPPLDEGFPKEYILECLGKYFDNVFLKASKVEKSVLKEIININPKIIATGHGVIIEKYKNEVMQFYEKECL